MTKERPAPKQALDLIISAIRQLPLKYDDHAMLDVCVGVIKDEIGYNNCVDSSPPPTEQHKAKVV